MRRALSAVLLAATPAASLAAQCAMCQTALSNSPEGQAMMGALSHGILLLLLAPYALVAGCGLILFRRPIAKWLATRRPRLPLASSIPEPSRG